MALEKIVHASSLILGETIIFSAYFGFVLFTTCGASNIESDQ